eukprot:1861323-Prymnesium_polylepis.1
MGTERGGEGREPVGGELGTGASLRGSVQAGPRLRPIFGRRTVQAVESRRVKIGQHAVAQDREQREGTCQIWNGGARH